MEPTSTAKDPTKEITFPNGNRATLIEATGQDPKEILQALKIEQPKALLMIAGGADTLGKDVAARLQQLYSRGLARAALAAEALIIDGGTQAGVMALMGQGVADRGRKTPLLGVAPSGKVTYPGGPAEGSIKGGAALDPNHSHFVLADADDWGGETETMFKLAEAVANNALAAPPSNGKPPAPPSVIMVLASGGKVTRDEALRCVRHGWPLIVIHGSGGTADDIAKAWQKRPAFIEDALLAEIVADGAIHLFPFDGTVEELEQRILHDTLLKRAWERFAVYDENAKRQQKSFNRLQGSILGFGVLAVFLALLQTQIFGTKEDPSLLFKTLHYVIIVVPILISILLAVANRFKAGNKWILLRAAAENIKSQIFQYRTHAGRYGAQQLKDTTREAKLAEQLKDITGQLMTTNANEAALRPYDGPIPPAMYGAAATDDGYSPLPPGRYITIRLGDQLSYFEGKTNQLERKLKVLQWSIYVIGGLGTLLAAVGFELWVALTAALAAAFTTYLEYQQTENTLTKYNQTAVNLDNVRNWWLGLTATERTDPTNVSLLVENTEQVLQSELTGWVQQMQDALATLQEQQAKEAPPPQDEESTTKGEVTAAPPSGDESLPSEAAAPPVEADAVEEDTEAGVAPGPNEKSEGA